MRRPLPPPANPGANSSVTIYDSHKDSQSLLSGSVVPPDGVRSLPDERVHVVGHFDQNVTLRTRVALPGTSELRLHSDATTTHTSGAVYATRDITCVAKASLVNNDYFEVGDGTTSTVYEFRSQDGTAASGTITCVAVAALLDNDYFTLADGVHAGTVFEYQKSAAAAAAAGSIQCPPKAQLKNNETIVLDDGVHAATTLILNCHPTAAASGSISCVQRAQIKNNETLTIGDGSNPATVFIFNSEAAAAATGSITCVAKSAMRNTDSLQIGDGTNPMSTFVFNVEAAAAATGTINCVATAALVNGDNFTLTDSVHASTVFEYKVDGTFVAVPGRVTIDVSGVTLAGDVALATAAAINGVGATLTIQATSVADAAITLTSDVQSYAENLAITENVASALFTVVGMSGGVTPFSAGTAIEVDITGDTTANDVATTLRAAINGVVGTLTVTAAEPVAGVIALTADASDYTHNVTILENCNDAGFTVSGMSGGATAFAAGGATEVDITAQTTAADVAGVLRTAINGVVGTLTVTANAPTGGVLPLVADASDYTHNVTILDTVADPGFIVSGMSGGAHAFVAGGATEVTLTTDTTGPEVAARLRTAINSVGATLAITAGAPSGSTVPLLNDAVGAAGNVAIIETIADAGLVAVGMSGGVTGYSATPGRVTIDVQADTTASDVALRTRTAINNVGATLAVTAGAPTGGVLPVTNDVTGAVGNVLITENVSDAGFSVSGLSGGIDPWVATAGRTTIDIRAVTTDVEVAGLVRTAINASTPRVTASGSTAAVTVTADVSGTAWTVAATEHVANAGFTIGTLTAGVDAPLLDEDVRLQPGRTVIDLVTTTACGEWAVGAEISDDKGTAQ